MNCNTNTMIKVAAGLGVALGVAYFAFPAAQILILAYAPLLLALICPLSMVAMMLMMKGPGGGKRNETTSADASVIQAPSDVHDAVPGKG